MTSRFYFPAEMRGLETDKVAKRRLKIQKHNGFTTSVWQFFDKEGKMLGMYAKTIREGNKE